MRKARQAFQRLVAQRSEFRIAHTPAALQLFNYKLAVQEQINFPCTELSGKINRSDDCTPLCDVVCGRADRCRD
jgi:hypothetical protein